VFATDDIFDLKSEVSVFFSYEAVLTNEIGAARNKLPRFGTDAVTHSARSHARGLLPNASNAQAASATRSCAVSDEDLVLSAEETFLELDCREAADAQS